jgi:hypothetical protein
LAKIEVLTILLTVETEIFALKSYTIQLLKQFIDQNHNILSLVVSTAISKSQYLKFGRFDGHFEKARREGESTLGFFYVIAPTAAS